MPLPTRNKGERRDEFLQRCMRDKTAISEFPNEKQRYAVCISKSKN